MSEDDIKIEEAEFEEIEPEEDDINNSISITPLDLDSSFAQIINLSDANTYHEPTCPICSNPKRKAAEDKWFETKTHKDVHEILKDSKIKISDGIIDNHIKNHCQRVERELQKVEFIDRISRVYASSNTSTLEKIGHSIAIIDAQIVELNAITANGDMSQAEVEKVKAGETKKLLDTKAKFIKMQADLMGEMRNAGEMINIPKDKFINFFNEAILNAENDEEKSIIQKLLSDLAKLGQED
jgi:hypothetical protein